jgi:hypothetical protein
VLDPLVRGVSLALAGLFVWAAAHKAHVVRERTAGHEPLMQLSQWRVRHAAALLAVATFVELTVAALLLLVPAAGFAAAAGLAVFYARELRRLPPDASCNCFGAVMAQGRTSAIHRNLVLSAIGLAGAATYLSGAAATTSISQGAVGVALMAGASIAAAAALTHLARSQQRALIERE